MTMPSACMPSAIEHASSVLAERKRDLDDAESAMRSVKVELDVARSDDRSAYAAARNAGEPDPGAKHVDAARAALDDAERVLEGERLRVAQAEDALAAHRSEWVVPTKLARNFNGDLYSLAELVDGVRDAISGSTLDAERERLAERKREQLEADELRATRARMTAG